VTGQPAILDLQDVINLGGGIQRPTRSWSYRIGAPQVGFAQAYTVPYEMFILSVTSTGNFIISRNAAATTPNLMFGDGGELICYANSNLVNVAMREHCNKGDVIYFFGSAQGTVQLVIELVPEQANL